MTNIIIRNENQNDYFNTEEVTRNSFWNVYKPGCDEHVMVHKLRNSNAFIPELDFVAEYNGMIVGNVICSLAKTYKDDKLIDDKSILFIGPICTLPSYQKQGIGSMLMKKVQQRAKELDYKGIVLYGNPAYYHRFGFVNAEKYSITTPQGTNFEDFMMYELYENSLANLQGKCFEDSAFDISKEELFEFEKQFVNKPTPKNS